MKIKKGITSQPVRYMCHADTCQKQPLRDVLEKRRSENMQQIYMRTPFYENSLIKFAKSSLLGWNKQ